MNNKIVAFALLGLLALTQVYAHKGCGYQSPRLSNSLAKTEANACFTSNPCDTASVRDTYIKAANSPMLGLRVNAIYFGSLTGDAKVAYDAANAFFIAKYKELLGINVILETKEVTSEFQNTLAGDKQGHFEIAQKYYREGWMTALYTRFENDTLLGGYAFTPQTLSFPADVKNWFTVMDYTNLSPTSTIIHHEVGHMLGLDHTFHEGNCTVCAENVNSPDRNLVGDLCSDTLPFNNERNCSEVTMPKDCSGAALSTDLTALPMDNYMSYTEATCQTRGFTPQQTGRVRCYLSTLVSFADPNAPKAPVAAPTKTSSATQATAIAALSLTALYLVL